MFVLVHNNLKPTQSSTGGLALILTEGSTQTQIRVYGPQGTPADRMVYLNRLAKDLKAKAPNGGYVDVYGNIGLTTQVFKGEQGKGSIHLPAFEVVVGEAASPAETQNILQSQESFRAQHLARVAQERDTKVVDTTNYRTGGRLGRFAQAAVEQSTAGEAEVGLPA